MTETLIRVNPLSNTLCGELSSSFALSPKKINRLKEDQAFWLSLELGRREKVVRHPSADFLPFPPFVYADNDAPSVLGGGGQDFVGTIIVVFVLKG
jgi:hypothetical protein